MFFAECVPCELLAVAACIIAYAGIGFISSKMKRRWGTNPKGAKYTKGRR